MTLSQAIQNGDERLVLECLANTEAPTVRDIEESLHKSAVIVEALMPFYLQSQSPMVLERILEFVVRWNLETAVNVFINRPEFFNFINKNLLLTALYYGCVNIANTLLNFLIKHERPLDHDRLLQYAIRNSNMPEAFIVSLAQHGAPVGIPRDLTAFIKAGYENVALSIINKIDFFNLIPNVAHAEFENIFAVAIEYRLERVSHKLLNFLIEHRISFSRIDLISLALQHRMPGTLSLINTLFQHGVTFSVQNLTTMMMYADFMKIYENEHGYEEMVMNIISTREISPEHLQALLDTAIICNLQTVIRKLVEIGATPNQELQDETDQIFVLWLTYARDHEKSNTDRALHSMIKNMYDPQEVKPKYNFKL